jgi:iron(III) transport system substrate-binding protein
VKMDFSWAADNRERILAEWTKRYNAKSEKR